MGRHKTICEAVQGWVSEFNAIPYGICVKLIRANCDEMLKITPPSANDRVYVSATAIMKATKAR